MMGRGLAELWARSGYKITIGSRDPDTVAFLTQDPNIDVDTVDEALKRGTCIVLCIPHTGIRPFVQRYSKYLHSKIVIDVANAVTVSDDLTFLSELGPHTTHGQWLQELLPNADALHGQNDRIFRKLRGNVIHASTQLFNGSRGSMDLSHGLAKDELRYLIFRENRDDVSDRIIDFSRFIRLEAVAFTFAPFPVMLGKRR